ncbi:penicillin acylase family protein [Pseudoalteromonas sp. OOF1S-7]|uniref:penicillin acylase family protein n=1 Tax=Pseudoalteromonas sp. OOF1S-7 TaxID=2917757 RepID=UPI001EF60C23|nr:penicillin acylase family protein [Pseudoalteromonas sp. OOF1S-7]MCG7537473.1 penicillin acylase family protein [Pseudoalteromonas sp. OOF1S-7]
MLTWLKRGVAGLVLLALAASAAVYGMLSLSLPALDGQGQSTGLNAPVSLERDALGQAVITAQNRHDAAYALGFAHGQDRFFQMDLLRRNAAGELSELFGKAAIGLDKRLRFHRFRALSQTIFQQLSESEQVLLARYTQGVNEGQAQSGVKSFEYLLLGAEVRPWQPEDSLLVIFSMYLDLQESTIKRDESLILVESLLGKEVVDFIMQPSNYQASLDNSEVVKKTVKIPNLGDIAHIEDVFHIKELSLYGSNNWAVTGQHTKTGSAMLSDDMHLGLNAPAIWYRAQLNYDTDTGTSVQVTGVTLPGAPAVVVGSNNHIAWGFTNGYLDTADWIKLDPQNDNTWQVTEQLMLPDGNSEAFTLTMSDYGPVKQIQGQSYALSWVAHQGYAVNLGLLALEQADSVDSALERAALIAIPVQNMVVVDARGNAAWRPTGAVPGRSVPSDLAAGSQSYSADWQHNETQRPVVKNPAHGRLWTANSRVVSAQQHQRFGDGGYALGARAVQIRDRLMAQSQFDEADFMRLQLDNEARFMMPWHQLLSELLANNGDRYGRDRQYLADWQACACPGSVGYTLVRRFRDHTLDLLFAPVEKTLQQAEGSLSPLKRYLEPAAWQLLREQPAHWQQHYPDWDALLLAAYEAAKVQLSETQGRDMAAWQWGRVNQLEVKHPFSRQMPLLSGLLDMPVVAGFGDSYMPAVQKPAFGASQRFIAQPGHLDNAIMSIAGGQSGHPLSPFYRAGFSGYAQGKAVPLLPGQISHRITFTPMN